LVERQLDIGIAIAEDVTALIANRCDLTAVSHDGSFQGGNPHTSLGSVGHWVRLAGILSPLIIGEFIKDPTKKWRAIRIATVATALLTEGMWTHKVGKEREAAKERALECAEQLATVCGSGAGASL